MRTTTIHIISEEKMIINQACSSRKRSDAKNWLWISRHRMILIFYLHTHIYGQIVIFICKNYIIVPSFSSLEI